MDPMLYSDICGARPQDNNYSWEEYERTADMAKAFDAWGPGKNKIYMGWRRVIFARDVLWYKYTTFLKRLWYKVGDGESFSSAISYAASQGGDSCFAYVDFSWVGKTDMTIY
jgi:hypothetical protein